MKKLLPLLLLVAPALLFPSSLSAKEYELPIIRVEARLIADGSLRITEYFTYDFEGSFSWAHRSLPLGEHAGYHEIRDVRISENGTAFINENSEKPGTFLVRTSDRMIDFRWFFQAEDQRRTFTVSYTLTGAVVSGPQWSEFLWTWVAGGREKATDSLDITLHLPREVAADSLHAWTRGPQQRISVSQSPGIYRLQATGIDDDASVRLRTVFPTSVFSSDNLNIPDPDYTLALAQQDEREYLERQEYNARLADIGGQIAILVAVLCIGCFWYFYNRYGKRHSVTGTGSDRRSLVPPGNGKPALVGWLLAQRNTTGGHLMATLLDLSRMGYFKIREQPAEEGGWLSTDKPGFTITSTGKQPDSGLLPWESDMLDFVRDRLDDKEMELKELFKQHSSDFSKWFSSWKKQIKSDAFSRGWIDEKSYSGAWWNTGFQIFLLLVAIVTVILAGPIGILAVGVTIVMAVCSLAIIRRTPEGEALYQNWKGYKAALSDAKEYDIRRDELDRHFIYAVALGAGEKGIEALFTAHPDAATNFAWIVILHSSGSSPASLATTFSTLNATGTAAFGGAAGAAGGGASAGVAGGGGSAGAG